MNRIQHRLIKQAVLQNIAVDFSLVKDIVLNHTGTLNASTQGNVDKTDEDATCTIPVSVMIDKQSFMKALDEKYGSSGELIKALKLSFTDKAKNLFNSKDEMAKEYKEKLWDEYKKYLADNASSNGEELLKKVGVRKDQVFRAALNDVSRYSITVNQNIDVTMKNNNAEYTYEYVDGDEAVWLQVTVKFTLTANGDGTFS